MTINYFLTATPGSLRVKHNLTINGESIVTTRQKEVLAFARLRITDKFVWKEIKEAVRLSQPLTMEGGK